MMFVSRLRTYVIIRNTDIVHLVVILDLHIYCCECQHHKTSENLSGTEF